MRLRNDRYDEIKKQVIHFFQECDVHTYPIDCEGICHKMGFRLIPYSGLTEKNRKIVKKYYKDGCCLLIEDKQTGKIAWRIYYNDSCCYERVRWTIMHEVGHIVLDHTEENEQTETEANFFAKYALAPPPLVNAAGCEDYIDIQMHFGLSDEAAYYAMKYFNKWLTHHGLSSYHDYEIQLLDLFGISA